ncbi:MAG: DUF2953 domain-containing protein [Bacillota bacterium]|nr:DUF2953 domain-containing protein [Bacillota bacterium]
MGCALAGLLLVVLLALAVCLWSPVSFQARAAFRAEAPSEVQEPSDEYLLALLTSVESAGKPLGDSRGDTAGAAGEAAQVWARLEFRARWLGGMLRADQRGVRLLGRRLGGGGRARTGPDSAESRGKDRPEDGEKGVRAGRRVRRLRRARGQARRLRRLDLATIRRLWPKAKRALAQTWARLRLTVHMRLTLGLDDPAATAMMAGMVGAMRTSPPLSAVVGRRGLDIRLTPVFDREVVAGDVELYGRTSAQALLRPWLRLALSRDVRRLWWPGRTRARNQREAEK